MNSLISKVKTGFQNLKVSEIYKKNAIEFLEKWIDKEEYKDYKTQIKHLIDNEYWEYLLDSFYQVIPFGTGGRRGEVGIGPNRINPWTIKASAQGHSQYLLKKYGDEAKKRGVVFAYDVREFFGNKYLSNELNNPVKNITSKDLAIVASQVYTANGIKVYFFDDFRTTPELSFAIRYLNAIAGNMFSASHNPPDHNGKKIYDEFGCQLIPPEDEELVTEVTKNVIKILEISYEQAINENLIINIDPIVDEKYIQSASSISLSNQRNIKIVYSPLHGCGYTSVFKALKKLGFKVVQDPKTSNPSGKFENVMFNNPNPEVIQSFETSLNYAKKINADIILNTDPDADRIGIMVKHNNEYLPINGNEIGVILTEYVIQKNKNIHIENKTIVKTTVTSNLIKVICEKNKVNIIGDLLIGFKYIANQVNKFEKQGMVDSFLLGCEESHGYLAGSYARDKDAVTAGIWLSELASELKKENKTLIDYLDKIYTQYGYYSNYLNEIRLLGASGKEDIDKIQSSLRKNPPLNFGEFKVISFEDCLNRKPIVSKTDQSAKDLLVFQLNYNKEIQSIKVTIRPSGTEPKIKIYFEVGNNPVDYKKLKSIMKNTEKIMNNLEKAVMMTCYKIIDIKFPKRGFLLFAQLPLSLKLKYFEVEPKIEQIKSLKNKKDRQDELLKLLSFLGSNPISKVDNAFKAKYKLSLIKYLNI